MDEGTSTAPSRREIGQRLVAEHRARIDRQRRFVEDLAASQHCDNVIQQAAESLRQMTSNLNVMLQTVSADTATGPKV